MKLLIIGSDGMLGSALMEAFADLQPTGYTRADLDITEEQAVREKIGELQPEVIINAAAYTNVDGAEEHKEEAALVNGYAVRLLAEAAEKVGATLLHYSTDYVFEGTKEEGYAEDDAPAEEPLNVYGASKLLGERELVQETTRYYLIRTSWLFGAGGKNFIETMIRLGSERDELTVVNDQHGKPTATKDLARATRALLEENYPFGIYHLVNEGGATTWYEYARFIFQEYGKQQSWKESDYPAVSPTSTESFGAAATRPQYSTLRNTKFPPLRPWQEAVVEYLTQRNESARA